MRLYFNFIKIYNLSTCGILHLQVGAKLGTDLNSKRKNQKMRKAFFNS